MKKILKRESRGSGIQEGRKTKRKRNQNSSIFSRDINRICVLLTNTWPQGVLLDAISLSHTLNFYSSRMPWKQGGQPGFMAMSCLPELLLTYSQTVTHCWHVTGRMLHFELMPVTSNSEEIELWNRGKSFDHWEKFCLTLYSIIFCLFCWYALFIPFSLLLVKSNMVLSAQGAVRANYFLIKYIYFLPLTLLRFCS